MRLLCQWVFPGKSTGVGCHGTQIAYDVNGSRNWTVLEVLSEIYWYPVPSNLFSLLVPQCDDFLHWCLTDDFYLLFLLFNTSPPLDLGVRITFFRFLPKFSLQFHSTIHYFIIAFITTQILHLLLWLFSPYFPCPQAVSSLRAGRLAGSVHQ